MTLNIHLNARLCELRSLYFLLSNLFMASCLTHTNTSSIWEVYIILRRSRLVLAFVLKGEHRPFSVTSVVDTVREKVSQKLQCGRAHRNASPEWPCSAHFKWMNSQNKNWATVQYVVLMNYLTHMKLNVGCITLHNLCATINKSSNNPARGRRIADHRNHWIRSSAGRVDRLQLQSLELLI